MVDNEAYCSPPTQWLVVGCDDFVGTKGFRRIKEVLLIFITSIFSKRKTKDLVPDPDLASKREFYVL
jgi:hypothetical protein